MRPWDDEQPAPEAGKAPEPQHGTDVEQQSQADQARQRGAEGGDRHKYRPIPHAWLRARAAGCVAPLGSS